MATEAQDDRRAEPPADGRGDAGAPAEPLHLEFREMRLEDLPEVLAIERVSFPTPWSRQSFINELTDNGYAHYVVALRDGRVVGYSGMWLILDEAHITNIAVHPELRGRGAGDLLLSEMERRARERGINRMTLEVRPSNAPARRLYLRHGFVERGIRKGYYADTQEDAIIMWKEDLGLGREE
ncbi:MAG: ribosomal protein S18-alanine N-acetyltransferase [Clostridia bacterium]|jgi:ribosomal-protein-alanine N-acetyltransferase|nr:ribosomal protein S18-alanine N-acetyltransferase [Clostridia bacterium]